MLTITDINRERHLQQNTRTEVLATLYETAYWTFFASMMEEKETMYVNKLLKADASKPHEIAKLQGKLELCREILNIPETAYKQTREE